VQTDSVILKPGKEKPILNRHHWIFSGAVQHLPHFENGTMLSVQSANGEPLGSAYFNRQAKIIGRMVAFGTDHPTETIKKRIAEAIALRKAFYHPDATNAYRVINGEGDGLPGLIVDVYDDALVLQFATLGMEKLAPLVLDQLTKHYKPKSIFEKSTSPSRKEEGLKEVKRLLQGSDKGLVEIKENGMQFYVDIPGGQKTGFFLDQSAMRQWVRELSQGKRVLNAFCYTGGFSIYALAGGAAWVDSVDISSQAIEMLQKNLVLNGFDSSRAGAHCDDVFKYLRENALNYDLVILDPPAFAKRKGDVVAACRGYKDINRLAMEKMPPKSLLLTCSCSYHVDEGLFQQVLFQAAVEARRSVKILGRHRQAFDHPVDLCHPEGNYLKSFLLYLE
jgi:23S rRNA (cytosine1962-C5)-methyltransferase